MANPNSTLLTAEERRTLYGVPVLNDIERTEYFTFTDDEIKILNSFYHIENAVYFAISLAFFKLKYTLINFSYQEVTPERQHVMKRYFPNEISPRNFPDDKDAIARIENKVLNAVGFSRFRKDIADKIVSILQDQACSYPRQRQLCKTLLNHMIKENVAIPTFTTVQDCVAQIWNDEQSRVIKSYYRYTTKTQRECVMILLDKTDDHHRIISIKKDMKQFNTESIYEELEKHQVLKMVFLIAKSVLPKLQLPDTTIDYYAQLINYYNGTRLKQLNPDIVSLYLLCYSYSRFQVLNDNLLEAFKKHTLNYVDEGNTAADSEASKFVDELEAIRYKVHDLLMTIKNDTHKTHIKKSKLYKSIPESELEITAKILVNDKLDKTFLFWRHIDQNESSIVLNLRPLFLNLDMTIVRNDSLSDVVIFMKDYLSSNKRPSISKSIISWISSDDLPYIVKNDIVLENRFEFLLYKNLTHHIATNKLILKFSVKHKDVDDNFITLPKWKKEKRKLLKSIPYPKLQLSSPTLLLEEKENSLKFLYQKTNHDIKNGNNKDVILKPGNNGSITWRLTSLEKTIEPNESLFLHFPKRSIVDIMRFVDAKTQYSKSLESILPKSIKSEKTPEATDAVILSNAIRMGSRAMASVCDFSLNQLLIAENENIRMETIVDAANIINTKAQELEIFKYYNIGGLNHISLDGLKLGTRIQNIKARHSPKFLENDTGVSSYNAIFNHFPVVGKLIGSNEYEGNFTFEMAFHQNMMDFKVDRASTDRHGINPFNFSWFDLADSEHAPRIPKPHRERLWGFGKHSDYSNLIITPNSIANKNYIFDEWDNMQRVMVSMLTGVAIPSVVLAKMSPDKYRSKTKLAFSHYNNIVKSEFILKTINDKQFRTAIEFALNRGEAFNNLYRAIALLNGGKFRGQSEAEMILWDQCTRLVASIILYYNAYILNHLYLNAKSQAEKDVILALSPGAWIHINMLGYYRFCGLDSSRFVDDWLTKWNWQQALKVG
jgi:TnpA family transposase